MDSAAAYDIALKIAGLYFTVLQFFIAICTLFGGWIIAGGLPNGTFEKWALVVVFVASTGTLLFGQLQLLKRSNAAISLSKRLLEEEGTAIAPDTAKLFSEEGEKTHWLGTILGMGGVIIAIVALILVNPNPMS
ncbi:MAG: hypothetical protein ABNH38_12155 [Tateyamaria sp.]|jgi:hypothetical protein|uniref:hypothetical protein n=1 Tax=Tateyamaria sp. TaxID=1929288 RepID=UPI0032DC956A